MKEPPNYYSQKKQLPNLKKKSVNVSWSGEELDLSEAQSLTLQEVCKRGKKTVSRYEDDYLATSDGEKLPSLKSFGQFFSIFNYQAEKAGVAGIEVNPAYTSQLLCYRDELVFTDGSIRKYWDEIEQVLMDRDLSAAVNIKRVGLDEFPTVKRRKGKPVIVDSNTDLTSKEVLSVFRRLGEARTVPS